MADEHWPLPIEKPETKQATSWTLISLPTCSYLCHQIPSHFIYIYVYTVFLCIFHPVSAFRNQKQGVRGLMCSIAMLLPFSLQFVLALFSHVNLMNNSYCFCTSWNSRKLAWDFKCVKLTQWQSIQQLCIRRSHKHVLSVMCECVSVPRF